MIDTAFSTGLSELAVETSRRTHGSNALTPPIRKAWWREYLSKFADPVIRILMIAAALATIVGVFDGKYAEGVGIIVAIALATFLAFWNERRASRAFDLLNQTSDDVRVKVLRGGTYRNIARREVVVGDTVLIEVGEEIPADGDLREAVNLAINQSRLTGESSAVRKTPGIIGESVAEPYSTSRLLRGTTVADGHGVFEATAVGDRTEFGRTLREASEDTDEPTPLNRQLAALSQMIGVVGFGIAFLTFTGLVLRGYLVGQLIITPREWLFGSVVLASAALALAKIWLPIVADGFALLGRPIEFPQWFNGSNIASRGGLRSWFGPWLLTIGAGVVVFGVAVSLGIVFDYFPANPVEWLPREAVRVFLNHFMIAVTIIVVAVPEGLAMSVTLSLAYSMRTMTAQNILVRRLHACETIGATTTICSDKTGTLTRNEMNVIHGNFGGAMSESLPTEPRWAILHEALAANTTAHLNTESPTNIRPLGNPTEGAMLLWLHAAGVDYLATRNQARAVRQLSFSSERKFMATIVGGTPRRLHLKGAPEIVLARSTAEATATGVAPLTASRIAELSDEMRSFQNRGMRVLGLACAENWPDAATTDDDISSAASLTWLGYLVIADPVRSEVPDAIAHCRKAGLTVKIVTGDNLETAREIATQIGLPLAPDGTDCILGEAFAALNDDEASIASQKLRVLARARPADKLRLVTLLKARGEVVAVTGDGVNDGPALNHANVGLAMGQTGTAVAKEASDIILLDDSFQSIVTAIRWGRALYENIQRFILFQLTINVVALSLAVLGPMIGFELPLTVMQMLWVNLIMDTFAALALATEPPHGGLMSRQPRHANDFIVTRKMAVQILGMGSLFLAVMVGLVLLLDARGELGTPETPTRGSTLIFSVFVLLQFWNLFNAKAFARSGSAFVGFFNNRLFLLIAILILLGQICLVNYGGSVFRTVALSAVEWLIVIAATSPVLLVGEWLRYRARRRARHVDPSFSASA